MLIFSDIYYVAGLVEGEGCFGINNLTPFIKVAMYDEYPISILSRIWDTHYYDYYDTHNNKIYSIQLFGIKAAQWMMTLYILLCPRRQLKIKEALTVWKSLNRNGKHYGNNYRCGRGHNRTKDNTYNYVCNGKKIRICKICQSINHKNYRDMIKILTP